MVFCFYFVSFGTLPKTKNNIYLEYNSVWVFIILNQCTSLLAHKVHIDSFIGGYLQGFIYWKLYFKLFLFLLYCRVLCHFLVSWSTLLHFTKFKLSSNFTFAIILFSIKKKLPVLIYDAIDYNTHSDFLMIF